MEVSRWAQLQHSEDIQPGPMCSCQGSRNVLHEHPVKVPDREVSDLPLEPSVVRGAPTLCRPTWVRRKAEDPLSPGFSK